MAEITPEQIEKVALLSRLALTPAQSRMYAVQLSQILQHAIGLDELDTHDVEPTSHPLALNNVFAQDEPRPSLTAEEALANAPDSESGCFKVPPIITQNS